MLYNIELLPSVWEDLKGIQDWYYWKFGQKSAETVIEHILDCLSNLAAFPDIGSLTPDSELNESGFRMLIIDKHIAIYKILNSSIFVYCVFDGRRDYPHLFKNMIK